MRLCGFEVGPDRPFFLIAGPCVIESEALVLDVAGHMKEIAGALGIPYIFKASFDKANRSSKSSFRGPGIAEGLRVLEEVRRQVGVPVLTDVHEDTPLAEVAAVVDVLQTPAFLCRQTNFILNACSQGRPVNVKKGQFCRPGRWPTSWRKRGRRATSRSWSASGASASATTTSCRTCAASRSCAPPGRRWFSTQPIPCSCLAAGHRVGWAAGVRPVLARAAVAAGVAGIFMETHPEPAKALSDGPMRGRSTACARCSPCSRKLTPP